MHQDDDVEVVEDSTEFTWRGLYKMITMHDSVIMYVHTIDIEKIKKGISNAKMRERNRNKSAGFEDDEERLDYKELPMISGSDIDKFPTGTIRLQVSLINTATVPVLKVVIPGDEM